MTGKTNAVQVKSNKKVIQGNVSLNNTSDTILDTTIKDVIMLAIGNASTANHLIVYVNPNGQVGVVVNRGFKKVAYLSDGKFALQTQGIDNGLIWLAS